MGYRIDYGQTVVRQFIQEKPVKNWRKTLVACLCAVVILVAFLACGGDGLLRTILFPGDSDVTDAAVSAFTDELKSGESVKTAFTTFCKEILEGAGVS